MRPGTSVEHEIEDMFDVWWEYKTSNEDFLTSCMGVSREDALAAYRAGWRACRIVGKDGD